MLVEHLPGEPTSFNVIPVNDPRHQIKLTAKNREQKRVWAHHIKSVMLEDLNIPNRAKELVFKLGDEEGELETDIFFCHTLHSFSITMPDRRRWNIKFKSLFMQIHDIQITQYLFLLFIFLFSQIHRVVWVTLLAEVIILWSKRKTAMHLQFLIVFFIPFAFLFLLSSQTFSHAFHLPKENNRDDEHTKNHSRSENVAYFDSYIFSRCKVFEQYTPLFWFLTIIRNKKN